MTYFTNSRDAVEFVEKALAASKIGSALTMTIGREKYGDYFAHIVIDELSADTDENLEQVFLNPRTSI